MTCDLSLTVVATIGKCSSGESFLTEKEKKFETLEMFEARSEDNYELIYYPNESYSLWQ